MNRTYPVVEHHFDARAGQFFAVEAGVVTDVRQAVVKLAGRRRAKDMPPTLSHWKVGALRVVAQNALTLMDRQGLTEGARG